MRMSSTSSTATARPSQIDCQHEADFHRHGYLEDLVERCHGKRPLTTAIVYPLDEISLVGVIDASRAGIISPVLVGPAKQIADVALESSLDISPYPVIDAEDESAAAEVAVECVRCGRAESLMKGSLHTSAFMHAVLNGSKGLRGLRRASHVFVFDVPAYDKPLFVTDAVVNIAPDLGEKADICRNAIDLAHALGIAVPKVAILSAVEVVDPAISSTVDAAALCKMADRGQISGAVLDGPLAFDNAINHAAADSKHIVSPVSGEADILVVPNLEAGNILYKNLTYMAQADTAGIVLGTRVPLILTSRADSARTRIASTAVASIMSRYRR
jgi:phosphotransacetylase